LQDNLNVTLVKILNQFIRINFYIYIKFIYHEATLRLI